MRMKKRKLYARFVKEAFFTSEEDFSPRKVNRLIQKIQKNKEVLPPTEPKEALDVFLNKEGIQPLHQESPTGKRNLGWGRIPRTIGSAAAAAIVICGVWGGFQIYSDRSEKGLEMEGISNSTLDQVNKEDGTSCGGGEIWEEGSKPAIGTESSTVSIKLEQLKTMSQAEIEEQLLGQSRKEIERQFGEPEPGDCAGDRVTYPLPEMDKVLWLEYSETNHEETVSDLGIRDIEE